MTWHGYLEMVAWGMARSGVAGSLGLDRFHLAWLGLSSPGYRWFAELILHCSGEGGLRFAGSGQAWLVLVWLGRE